jgi:hypothetical protein
MGKGTVNISRSIWSDVAFKKQPFTEREAFMWLIMEASYLPREKRVGSVIVQTLRGQCATSVRFMADAWNWPKSTVSRFLKRLENRDMIGTDSGTGVTLITISKYDDYQAEIKESGTPIKPKAGQQRDSSGTNYKKGLIKDNNITPSISPPIDELFDQFWNACPRRVGKGQAEKKFKAALKVASFDEIMRGLARYSMAVDGKDKNFVKHPSTWLNGKCWLDEPGDIAPEPASQQSQEQSIYSQVIEASYQ